MPDKNVEGVRVPEDATVLAIVPPGEARLFDTVDTLAAEGATNIVIHFELVTDPENATAADIAARPAGPFVVTGDPPQ